MTAGRPTSYKPEYCEKLIEYIDGGEEAFPTLAGFAGVIGVHRDTLHEWSSAKGDNDKLLHPEFSDAIKRFKALQEHDLVGGALTGRYNPTFSIFFAKNNLGYSDKRELDHTTQGQRMGFGGMSDAELEDIANGKS